MSKICYNGTLFDESQPVLKAGNKGYRYGDGFFETLKVLNGQILLAHYHKKRMEKSLALLNYTLPEHTSVETLFSEIIDLCRQNHCIASARVRLSFSNGNGGLYERNEVCHYLIEAVPLKEKNFILNSKGLLTGIFTAAKKSCDAYANIKSSSALIYSVAAQHALQNGWDDCMIINQKENICESSIANLFWVKDGKIFTPPLTEGCVEGVMRSCLVNETGIIIQSPCTLQDLQEADEVFVTNAIKGIRWIRNISTHHYTCNLTEKIFHQYIRGIS